MRTSGLPRRWMMRPVSPVYWRARHGATGALSATGTALFGALYRRNAGCRSGGLLAANLNVAADAQHHHGMMLDAAGHQIIDLGDDFYTVGRPHPMIDPALRNQLITDLGSPAAGAVLLVDVVIGYRATADPAASLVEAWQRHALCVTSTNRCLRSPR